MRLPRVNRLREQLRWRRIVVLAAVSVAAALIGSWLAVALLARGQIVDLVEAPAAEVVIVPGARVGSTGNPSLALRQRLDAAALLYDSGTVEHVLVSGDNRTTHYNEPVAMQQYLRGLGVPAEAITLDYAGFDTWDTCLRASEQFGVSNALVVTQPRFAQRTTALCQRAGINITAATTDDYVRRRSTGLQADIRERLAVVKALGDLLATPEAHHGGPFVGLIGSDDENL